jgi:galactokinase
MDVSNFAMDIVLSQFGKGKKFHLVNFHSHKFSLVEINYNIHDKVIIAIVDAFEEW